MPDELDWTDVRAFALVARHGSLSAAARAGGTSQPTLGRRISALERGLGVRLFDRRASGLAPTPTGLALLEHAHAMAGAADRLVLAAGGRASAVEGTVRITASEIVATYVLPTVLARLRIDEPGIALEIDASNRTGNLLEREADVAVRMYRPTQADVVTRRVGSCAVGAFASRGYLARRGTPVRLEDLAGHDVIGYDTDDQLLRGLREAGLPVERDFFPVRCDDQVVCWQLVLAGAGIGFTMLDVAARSPDVVHLFGERTVATLPVWLTAHAELRTSARVRRVYDALAAGLAGEEGGLAIGAENGSGRGR